LEILSFEATEPGEAINKFKNRKNQLAATLDYLKDK
jgi:hypothetical protein